MKQLLIVEDDPNIAGLVEIHMKDLGFEVDKAFDGREGLKKGVEKDYDFIILDVMLPEMDGFEICRHLRIEKKLSPILFLTSKSEELDKVLGLEMGADDYLTKPFSVRELIARVKAILRRSEIMRDQKQETQDVIKCGDLTIDVNLRIVTIEDRSIDLSPKEFDLLVFLARNPGKTFSRHQLLEKIWGYEFSGYEHTVNSHVNRLRAKIETDMAKPKYILTTWGVGYKFNLI